MINKSPSKLSILILICEDINRFHFNFSNGKLAIGFAHSLLLYGIFVW